MNDNYMQGGRRRFSVFPPVIKSLIIINLVIFAVPFLFGDLRFGGSSLMTFIQDYLYLQPLGSDTFYPWQLITYQFFHGGLMHIFFNLFALWMFGAELETLWGSNKFTTFYLISGIGGGLLQLFSPELFGATPAVTLGASGAIFGVLVAFGLTFPNRPIFMFPIFIPIPAKWFVLGYAGLNIISAMSGGSGMGSDVAYFAHIGGLIAGFLLLRFGDRIGLYRLIDKLTGSRSGSRQTYSKYQENPYSNVYQARWEPPKAPKVQEERKPVSSNINVNGEEITQSKIDSILDKISQTGYQNLTEKEKQILFELSQKLR